MPASPDTLIRLIRRKPLVPSSAPRILGVDDWAFRRGQRYGTILCDLERRQVIDLLPERSAEALAAWLLANPGVEVVSRDRGDYYIKGAAVGAPNAVQVADRWHLHDNLRDAIARIADRHPHQLLAAARTVHEQQSIAVEASGEKSPTGPSPKSQTCRREEQQFRQARRRERFEQAVELHRQKVPLREIARRLDLSRATVKRYVRAMEFPEHAARPHTSRTDRFLQHLQQRWEEGCRNAAQLTKELRDQGYKGSYNMVRRRVASWRRRNPTINGPTPASRQANQLRRPSSNRIAWLMLKPESDFTEDDRLWVQALEVHCPTLKHVSRVAKKFTAILRDKRHEDLDAWIVEATNSDVAEDLCRFAKGLVADLQAVRAAIELPWSNGQTEGQINRLKMIKRQMFGRAKFDLLRHRVLEAVA